MTVKVFGADWCPMTQRTLMYLRDKRVEFVYTDIDNDPDAAEWVADQNNGKEKKPTLDIDGRILTEPSNAQLEKALKEAGLLQ